VHPDTRVIFPLKFQVLILLLPNIPAEFPLQGWVRTSLPSGSLPSNSCRRGKQSFTWGGEFLAMERDDAAFPSPGHPPPTTMGLPLTLPGWGVRGRGPAKGAEEAYSSFPALKAAPYCSGATPRRTLDYAQRLGRLGAGRPDVSFSHAFHPKNLVSRLIPRQYPLRGLKNSGGRLCDERMGPHNLGGSLNSGKR